MKKSMCDKKLTDINISPIKHKPQYEMTPMKPKRKTSRRDHGSDVHATAACSTPNRPSGNLDSTMNSPSYSFPYSQENCPDVVWDYTSPKLPKGAKRKEIKITVDEFLKTLSQRKVPECNTQTSHYIKLLEKWMVKQNTPMCVKKPPINVRRKNQKRSRRVIEEIKEFMESIKVKNVEKSEENKKEEHAKEENITKTENNKLLNCSLNKMSFLQGDTNDNDSTEELWGEVDNSFIIKATQQLDVPYDPTNSIVNKNIEIISTIPETLNIPNKPNLINPCVSKSEENSFDPILDEHAQILLTQIINCEWDSASDDEWDKGFIEEDDVLSRIPDEVLCGTDSNFNENFSSNVNTVTQNSDIGSVKYHNENKQTGDIINGKILLDGFKSETGKPRNLETAQSAKSDSIKRSSTNSSGEIIFGYCETETPYQTATVSEAEVFNTVDDESFGDESILCKPEVLSWIDEVENQLTQSQRCTPEEIEKKKVEAMQRRKRNQTRNKVS